MKNRLAKKDSRIAREGSKMRRRPVEALRDKLVNGKSHPRLRPARLLKQRIVKEKLMMQKMKSGLPKEKLARSRLPKRREPEMESWSN